MCADRLHCDLRENTLRTLDVGDVADCGVAAGAGLENSEKANKKSEITATFKILDLCVCITSSEKER